MIGSAAGAAIRALRLSRGWSLTELSLASGVSCQFLGEVESGRKNGSRETIERIARGLGVAVDDLGMWVPASERCGLVRRSTLVSDEDAFCAACPECVPDGCLGVCLPANDDFGDCPEELREVCPCCRPATVERLEAHRLWLVRRQVSAAVCAAQDGPVADCRRRFHGRDCDLTLMAV